MAEKILINTGATVTINTSVGYITIQGNGVITSVTEEQLAALNKRSDFKTWVAKGFIMLDAPLKRVNEKIAGQVENDLNAQLQKAAAIKLEALAEAIQKNEGIKSYDEAIAEARKRLNEEADKASQAGDNDAEELRAAANAEVKTSDEKAKEAEQAEQAEKVNAEQAEDLKNNKKNTKK